MSKAEAVAEQLLFHPFKEQSPGQCPGGRLLKAAGKNRWVSGAGHQSGPACNILTGGTRPRRRSTGVQASYGYLNARYKSNIGLISTRGCSPRYGPEAEIANAGTRLLERPLGLPIPIMRARAGDLPEELESN